MTRARFNHMELTFERGTLDGALRADIYAFYGDVFGSPAKDIDLLDQQCHFLRIDERPFILLAERELAKQVFQLLGCTTLDRGGEFVSAMVDGGDVAAPNNVLYVSEVTPEQWDVEQALQAVLDEDGKLHAAADAYLARLRREPQR